jgi:hypothetical protein
MISYHDSIIIIRSSILSSICGIGIMLKAMEFEETKPQINADERRLNALSEEITRRRTFITL